MVVWLDGAVVVVVVGRGLVVVVRVGLGVGVVVAGGGGVLLVTGGRPCVCGLAPLLVNANTPSADSHHSDADQHETGHPRSAAYLACSPRVEAESARRAAAHAVPRAGGEDV